MTTDEKLQVLDEVEHNGWWRVQETLRWAECTAKTPGSIPDMNELLDTLERCSRIRGLIEK